jgi:hypothetical protein
MGSADLGEHLRGRRDGVSFLREDDAQRDR